MFTYAQSDQKPLVVENAGNSRYVIRRNIRETTNDKGEKVYDYEEDTVSKDVLDVMQHMESVEVKRETAIIDEYTMQLIEEGSL